MWRSLVLGVVTGLRSQLPTAVLAWRQSRHELPHDITGTSRIVHGRGVGPAVTLAAAGELVADKLPQTPSRLDAGPFLGRLSFGATAGAGVAAAFGRSRLLGGVLGIAGAAAGSYAGTRYRALVAERSEAPDIVWAIAEDAAALMLALTATRANV